jgi:hypothetical protein
VNRAAWRDQIGHVEEIGSGGALRDRGSSVSDHPLFQDSEPLRRIVTRPARRIVTRVCIFVKTFILGSRLLLKFLRSRA